MSQNLSSAAVMIGTLRVKTCFTVYCTSIKDPGILFLPECHTRDVRDKRHKYTNTDR